MLVILVTPMRKAVSFNLFIIPPRVGRFFLALIALPLVVGCGTLSSVVPAHSSQAGNGASQKGTAAHTSTYQQALTAFMAAEWALHAGRLEEAASWYARTAELGGYPRLYARAVELAIRAEQASKAESYAQDWQDLAPRDPEPLVALARARIIQGDQEGTTRALERLIQTHPEARSLYLRLSSQLAMAGGIEAAQAVLTKIVTSLPQQAAAHLAYGHLLARLGKQEQAAESLRTAHELSPDSETVVVALARAHSSTEGLEILREFLADHPQATRARQVYAEGLLHAGDLKAAAEIYQGLVERQPHNVRVRLGLAQTRFRQERWEEARSLFQGVLDQHANRPAALFYLGRIAENEGNLEAAERYYRRVPHSRFTAQARLRQAQVAVKAGKLEQALQLVRRLHSLYSNAPQFYHLEAQIMMEMDQHEAALEALNQGLERDPDSASLLYTRALLHEKRGRFEQMEADIRQVIEQDPEDADAYNLLGYSLAERGVRLREALSLIQKANELNPEKGYIVDSLGWVYYRLGQLDKAESHLRRAVELSDGEGKGEIYFHLGEVLNAQGRSKAARKAWKRALQRLDPDSGPAREVEKRLKSPDS